MTESVNIVIPFFEGEKYLNACLDSLLNATYPINEILIVDNGYTPIELPKKYKNLHQIRLIRTQAAIGFGRACNIGVYECMDNNIDIAIILNQDTVVERECIARMVEGLREDEDVFAIAPLSYNYDFTKIYKKIYSAYVEKVEGYLEDVEKGTVKRLYQVDNTQLNGACVAFDLKYVSKIGLFDPIFYMYGEETDLFRRVELDHGLKLGFAPLAKIGHEHQNMMATKAKRKRIDFQIRRSMQICILKYPKESLWMKYLKLLKYTASSYVKSILNLSIGHLPKYFKSDFNFLFLIPTILKHCEINILKQEIQNVRRRDLNIRQKDSI